MPCYKLPQHPRSVFSWHLDVCKSSVYIIHLIINLDNSDNELFQLIGEASCLFITLTWQATKTCALLTAFGFSENLSGRCFESLIRGFP